jgi:tRNA A-37 threonylcarbamoyl transferase component Bud32
MTDSAFADLVQQAEERIGTTLKGKWRIDGLLGVGGMACVYAATHRNNKRVAVKMLHPALSMLRTVRERFQREGYVANSVGHSGAVSVDDDDVTEDGCAFLVMELLEGETLEARRVRLGGTLQAEEVLAAIEQVLSTLAAAHAKGIVHRDLKPDNLFLTRSGETKVLDFGIARLRDLALSTAHTRTGNLMGTPAFMPPEQARARWEEVDAQSDIWAVGATMFTLLTGEGVHSASTFNELLITAATSPAPSLGARMPALHHSVSSLVDGALAFQKADRWPDAATMRRAVRRSLVSLDDASEPAAAVERDGEWTDEPTTAVPNMGRDPALVGERITTTPGLEQTLAKRGASGASVAWALGALLATGIVLAIVFARRDPSVAKRTPGSDASVQAAAAEAAATGAREPRVLPEASLPRAVPVQDLPLAPATAGAPTGARASGTLEVKPSVASSAIPLPETPEPVESGFVHRAPAARRQLDDGGLLDNPYR